MTDPRAIIFDLDDTLYPHRAFVRSGLRAAGRQLAEAHGLSPRAVLRVIRGAMMTGRGRELQALCMAFHLPASMVPSLVGAVRDHVPDLTLPSDTRRVLSALRATWRVGILTNGNPQIQRRKVRALGLAGLVDDIVCAAECGDGTGKPAAPAFHAALGRLGARPESTVFVGDDVLADIGGAASVGMRTIHFLGRRPTERRGEACACGTHVERLEEVPGVADRLVPARTHGHGH